MVKLVEEITLIKHWINLFLFVCFYGTVFPFMALFDHSSHKSHTTHNPLTHSDDVIRLKWQLFYLFLTMANWRSNDKNKCLQIPTFAIAYLWVNSSLRNFKGKVPITHFTDTRYPCQCQQDMFASIRLNNITGTVWEWKCIQVSFKS